MSNNCQIGGATSYLINRKCYVITIINNYQIDDYIYDTS